MNAAVPNVSERAAGAILGALIGDALGLGPHWYYDLEEMRRDYGPWIEGYRDPKPHRYHGGLRGGQLSQAGIILTLLLRSVAERGSYDEADFCRRLDDEILARIDGKPMSGPGGYTSQSIRELYRQRVEHLLPWGQTGGHADTTEAAERALVLAVRYALEPQRLAETVVANTVLTQNDELVVSMTTAYCATLGLLVFGEPFDPAISDKLMALAKSGTLPFHVVTEDRLQPPKPGAAEPPRAGRFASPDALLSPGYMAEAAADPGVRIEPAWKVSIVYGMPCAIYHQLPAAYYLAARFSSDFESAVLHAVNGGGQNQSRAILTGALVGAQCGLSGIPQRFIEGLDGHAEWIDLAKAIAPN
jgi:ADP-ribosylglycohydrolase